MSANVVKYAWDFLLGQFTHEAFQLLSLRRHAHSVGDTANEWVGYTHVVLSPW